MKNFIKTCIAVFIGVNLTGLGVALFVQCNLGSDTITVFEDGLRHVLNISIGEAALVYNIATLVIALIMSRKDIGWCTIIYAIIVGYFIDFYSELLLPCNLIAMSIIVKFGLIVVGQLCFALTFALLIKYRNGMNQMDAITYGIVRRTNISYKIIRTGMDVLLLISGWLMGGVVGVGSIFAMATTGILVDFFVKLMNRN